MTLQAKLVRCDQQWEAASWHLVSTNYIVETHAKHYPISNAPRAIT